MKPRAHKFIASYQKLNCLEESAQRIRNFILEKQWDIYNFNKCTYMNRYARILGMT